MGIDLHCPDTSWPQMRTENEIFDKRKNPLDYVI